MGVVFIFQTEHHLALTAGSVFGHGIDGERNLCLLVAARGRHLAPVGLAGHLPFALGIHYKALLMFRGQGASYRGAAHQLVVGGYAFKLVPPYSRLILCHGRFGHLYREVVFRHAVKSSALYIGWIGTLTNDRTYVETIFKSTGINDFHISREHQTFYLRAMGKSR